MVLVKVEDESEMVSSNGIVMGKKTRGSEVGIVIDVGPNVKSLMTGDKIIMPSFNTSSATIMGDDLKVFKETDVNLKFRG